MFTRTVVLCVVLFLVISTSFAVDHPNILFILTDDQAAWAVGASGNPDAYTPNIDRLYREGAVLTNAFVTTPVCSPSRAGLLAGRYGTEVGITDWINPRGGEFQRKEDTVGLDPESPTWVRRLRDAGYRIALIGKWHLGTLDRFDPSHFGYESFSGFRAGGASPENPELEVDGETKIVPGLTVDIFTDYAIDFLRERDAAKPFLLSLHFRSPHAPWLPGAPEDLAPYDGKPLAVPEPDFPDLDTQKVEHDMREYLSSVTGVDRNIGRVLAALDELGLAQNTVVIFTSDHGYNVGHHGLLHKGNGGWMTNATRDIPFNDPRKVRPNMFDTSLRVPCVVRWPGVIESGSRVERVVTNLDWYQTLLAIAGLPPETDPRVHGRNFVPLLRGESTHWDDTFYGEYSIHHYTQADLRMLRTPEWKLVRDLRNPGHDEFYHLTTDPNEIRNLIDDPQFAKQLKRLDRELKARMRTIGSDKQQP